MTNGTYYHVAAVVSGTTMYAYVNGQLAASNGSISTTTNITAIHIGLDSISGIGSPDPFSGNIDDVRIYSRALSGGEIQALYNAGR